MTRVSTAGTLRFRYPGSLYIPKERGVAPLHIIRHDYTLVSTQRRGYSQITSSIRVPHHRQGPLYIHVRDLFIGFLPRELPNFNLIRFMGEYRFI